ncbi:hypothetical protein VN24_17570 [Paenibacillus beijingensis]|uniref:Uncharacterized protein n=1 Tax=Paenibacillus beijingensis TaxID=1126833 RepID=A0A0D5NM72_9BACL|nr:hypothetical protein VN24_17570 [Paenibacillus beijingensis]
MFHIIFLLQVLPEAKPLRKHKEKIHLSLPANDRLKTGGSIAVKSAADYMDKRIAEKKYAWRNAALRLSSVYKMNEAVY